MSQSIEDIYSLGLEPIDVLGFSSEEELLEALGPLMNDKEIKETQAAYS